MNGTASRRADDPARVPPLVGIAVVVVDCASDRARADENLAALRRCVGDRAEVVVVRGCGLVPLESAAHRSRRPVRQASPPPPTSPAPRAAASRGGCMRIGVDSAPGHAVLFTDTESRVSDDWFDAATAALTSGAQLIGGPVVTNPSGLRRPVDAAGFALDYGRHATPPFLNAEGHPSANNFGAARALLDAAPSGDLWKSQLCSWAQGHGVETSPVTAMLVTSTKRYTPGSLVLDQLQRGRIHGALRRPTLGIFARLARIIGAPGVPLIAALRLRGSMPSGRRRARTWSITLFGLCGWAIGEAIGYAAGPAPTSRGFG